MNFIGNYLKIKKPNFNIIYSGCIMYIVYILLVNVKQQIRCHIIYVLNLSINRATIHFKKLLNEILRNNF